MSPSRVLSFINAGDGSLLSNVFIELRLELMQNQKEFYILRNFSSATMWSDFSTEQDGSDRIPVVNPDLDCYTTVAAQVQINNKPGVLRIKLTPWLESTVCIPDFHRFFISHSLCIFLHNSFLCKYVKHEIV